MWEIGRAWQENEEIKRKKNSFLAAVLNSVSSGLVQLLLPVVSLGIILILDLAATWYKYLRVLYREITLHITNGWIVLCTWTEVHKAGSILAGRFADCCVKWNNNPSEWVRSLNLEKANGEFYSVHNSFTISNSHISGIPHQSSYQ